MLPMSLPIFVVAVILQVTGIWNDFLFGRHLRRPREPADDGPAQQHRQLRAGRSEYNVNMAATMLTALAARRLFRFRQAFRPRHRRRRGERDEAMTPSASRISRLSQVLRRL
jgi:ABC-type glycerol-3-phosphate transport system permease component